MFTFFVYMTGRDLNEADMQTVPCVDTILVQRLWPPRNSSHPLGLHFPFLPSRSLLSAVLVPSIMLPSSLPPLHRPLPASIPLLACLGDRSGPHRSAQLSLSPLAPSDVTPSGWRMSLSLQGPWLRARGD